MDKEQGKKEENKKKGRDLGAKEEVDHRGDQRGSGCGRVAEEYEGIPFKHSLEQREAILPLLGQPQNQKGQNQSTKGLEAETFSLSGLSDAVEAIESGAAGAPGNDDQLDRYYLLRQRAIPPPLGQPQNQKGQDQSTEGLEAETFSLSGLSDAVEAIESGADAGDDTVRTAEAPGKDGQPDRHYFDEDLSRAPALPLRKDGKVDMRYAVNKAAALGGSGRQSVSHPSKKGGTSFMKDGHPDMRYNDPKSFRTATLDAEHSVQRRKDGLPWRFKAKADRTAVLDAEHSVQPLKKDGTPDPNYKKAHAQVYLSLNPSKWLDSTDQGIDTRFGGLSLTEACRIESDTSSPPPSLSAIVQEVFETQQVLKSSDENTSAHLAKLRHLGRKLLVTAPYKDTSLDHEDDYGRSSLMQAVLLNWDDVFYRLLVRGADINVQDKEGRTALMYAVMCRQMIFTERLISGGANLELQDQKGRSAMDLAADEEIRLVIELAREKRARSAAIQTSGESNKRAAKGSSTATGQSSASVSTGGLEGKETPVVLVEHPKHAGNQQHHRDYYVLRYPLYDAENGQPTGALQFAVIPKWACIPEIFETLEVNMGWRLVAEQLGHGSKPDVVLPPLAPVPGCRKAKACRCQLEGCDHKVNAEDGRCAKQKQFENLCSKCGLAHGVRCEHQWWETECSRGIQGGNACGMQTMSLAYACSRSRMGMEIGLPLTQAINACNEPAKILLCAKISSDLSTVQGRFHKYNNGQYVPTETWDWPEGWTPAHLTTLVTRAFGNGPYPPEALLPAIRWLRTPWPPIAQGIEDVPLPTAQGFVNVLLQPHLVQNLAAIFNHEADEEGEEGNEGQEEGGEGEDGEEAEEAEEQEGDEGGEEKEEEEKEEGEGDYDIVPNINIFPPPLVSPADGVRIFGVDLPFLVTPKTGGSLEAPSPAESLRHAFEEAKGGDNEEEEKAEGAAVGVVPPPQPIARGDIAADDEEFDAFVESLLDKE